MANLNVGSLGEYIRQQRRTAEISLRQLAEAAGVSNPYLSQIERGLRKPSADILQQIAKGLRISSEALYIQAGILEDQEGNTEVPVAIRADPVITERQKQVLVDIYDSFRRENRDAGQAADAAQTPRDERGAEAGRERRAGGSGPEPARPAEVWEEATDVPAAGGNGEDAYGY